MTTLTIDNTAHRAPGLPRTWLVELRKLVDTRSGLTLVLVAVILAGASGGGILLVDDHVTLTRITTMAGMPGGLVAAVTAILLVAGERTHRTALITYTLTPRRGQVVAAKAAATVTLALSVTLLALMAALIIAPVGTALTGAAVDWSLDWMVLAEFTAINTTMALSGWALAYAFGNAPAAIVLLLVWEMASNIISLAGPVAAEIMTWLDQAAISYLMTDPTWADLGRAATGLTAWIVFPAVIGITHEVRTVIH